MNMSRNCILNLILLLLVMILGVVKMSIGSQNSNYLVHKDDSEVRSIQRLAVASNLLVDSVQLPESSSLHGI